MVLFAAWQVAVPGAPPALAAQPVVDSSHVVVPALTGPPSGPPAVLKLAASQDSLGFRVLLSRFRLLVRGPWLLSRRSPSSSASAPHFDRSPRGPHPVPSLQWLSRRALSLSLKGLHAQLHPVLLRSSAISVQHPSSLSERACACTASVPVRYSVTLHWCCIPKSVAW